METTTKQCPFCAETIQAAAIVCRYCGRDLVANVPAPAQPATSPAATDPALDQALANYTRDGWRVISQTNGGFQVVKPKQWSAVGIVLFVVLPAIAAIFFWPIIGVALLGLIFVTADYLLKKEQLAFVTSDTLKQEAERLAHPHIATDKISGRAHCSACQEYVRADATTCKTCGATFGAPA